MPVRKQELEIARTCRRLVTWLDRQPQGQAQLMLTLNALLEDISTTTGVSVNIISADMKNSPMAHQATALVYEESLLMSWNRVGGTRPIDDFITKQARRERPLGRRFLTALAQSTPRLWEVVKIDPGSSLSIRPLRAKRNAKDTVRQVFDSRISETVDVHDCVLGRILPMPKGLQFSTVVMPINRREALPLCAAPTHTIVQAGFVAWTSMLLREFGSFNINEHGMPSSSNAASEGLPLNNDTAPHQRTALFTTTPTESPNSAQVNLGNASPENTSSRNASPEYVDTGNVSLGNTNTGNANLENSNLANTSSEQAGTEQAKQHTNDKDEQNQSPPPDREKLLERIRKLFAMAQETKASPFEAEIALRRCQKLMTRYGIQESDLHTSQFSAEAFRSGYRVPTYIKWLAEAVQDLHSVLFVTGGGEDPEFRGFEIDVKVAKMTMEYLENAVERSLTTRRSSGSFPPGRSAAYDYRVSFAMEVHRRVSKLVDEREAHEAAASSTGTALTVKKMEIVEHECGHDLITKRSRLMGARSGDAADAGRFDGSKVSLEPQVEN